MAGFPQDRVEIGFEFKRGGDGTIRAILYDPVNNFYGLEIPGNVEEDRGRYVIPWYVTSIHFRRDRDHVEGTFLPLNFPLVMTRAQNLPTDPPMPAIPAGPAPRWRTKLGGGMYAPVAVRNDIAYVGTTGGTFNAASVKDGSIAWAVPVDRRVFAADYPGGESSAEFR